MEPRVRARLPAAFPAFDALDRAQYVEVVTFLEGYLLHTQADRMLMGHSVEGRFPYLDHRLAEFAARLPRRLRLAGLHEKVGLRRAVAGLVPAEVSARRKWPYRAPIAAPLLEQRVERNREEAAEESDQRERHGGEHRRMARP